MRVLLVVYDNGSYIHWFPQGLGSIAAVLRAKGHEVLVYNQDMHHYEASHLTDYLDHNNFDVIGVSVIAGYYQHKKLLEISEAINKSKHRPLYIIGGHGPSPEPEYFLRKTGADLVVMGEGEETILEVMGRYELRQAFDGVRGIAYRQGDGIVVNQRRPLIRDIDSLPLPAYDLFPIEYYRLLRMPHTTNDDFAIPVLSGRGCTFNCTFCYRMDDGFRPRSSTAIVDEIRYLKKKYRISYIAFSDELLMSSTGRTRELCEAFLAADLGIKWCCNGRLNYAVSDILHLMKRAGCVFINYGIEAFDDSVLRKMNKALTTKQIVEGIEATLREGLSPGFNIIFGNIGDTRQTLQKGVDFLLKYDDGAQMRTIRPVTPYPGSPLYYYAIEKGLLGGIGDFYEKKHLNSDLVSVNFTDMTDQEFHNALYKANSVLLNNYFNKSKQRMNVQMNKLYTENDSSFRGFRQS